MIDGLLNWVGDLSLCNKLIHKGLEQIKQFTWDKTAKLTWQVLEGASQR
jgi:hypothetical protein